MAVFVSGAVKVPYRLYDNFADNSWETIIWACQKGIVPDTWTVGSQKPMTINGVDYPIDIIGLNHDDYSVGSGKAPITFQMHDCYADTNNMNIGSNSNNGGWGSCDMKKTHLPAILALMPSEVQAGIREVNKLTSAGYKSSTIHTTADKLFLLSEIEIYGGITNSVSGEGSQYAYYSAGNSVVKNRNGSAQTWFERSPYLGNTTSFCGAGGNGIPTFVAASSSVGVAFAFCF